MNEQEKPMTPKQVFDAEMKSMNDTISNAPEKEAGFTDQEVREHEEEVEAIDEQMEEMDKSMGDVKVSTTREEHQQRNPNMANREILEKLSKVGSMKGEKLTATEKDQIQKVMELERDGKLKDPVLKHMVSRKIKISQEKLKVDARIKEFQTQIVKTMSGLANEAMNCVNAFDTFNNEILEYLKDNPDLEE